MITNKQNWILLAISFIAGIVIGSVTNIIGDMQGYGLPIRLVLFIAMLTVWAFIYFQILRCVSKHNRKKSKKEQVNENE